MEKLLKHAKAVALVLASALVDDEHDIPRSRAVVPHAQLILELDHNRRSCWRTSPVRRLWADFGFRTPRLDGRRRVWRSGTRRARKAESRGGVYTAQVDYIATIT